MSDLRLGSTARPFCERATCPKCGSTYIAVQWLPVAASWHQDVIRRKCARCGYGWNETPLDARGKV